MPGLTQLQRAVLAARLLARFADLSAAELQLVSGICKSVPASLQLSKITLFESDTTSSCMTSSF